MEPKFQVYRDAADEWRWRLLAANGKIVATSGEGYGSAGAAEAGSQVVRRISTDAVVEVLRPEVKEQTRTALAVDKLKAGRGRQEIPTPPFPENRVERIPPPGSDPLAGNQGAGQAPGPPPSSSENG